MFCSSVYWSCRRDHCRRASRFQSRKEHHRTNIQSQNPLREIPAWSAESLPCLHRLQEGFWQGMARSLMGNYEQIQHQCQHHTSHWKNLYDKAQSAVLFNGSTGEWFRTTVGVRQGCLLSSTLFNIFLERIMCKALDDHEGSVSNWRSYGGTRTPRLLLKLIWCGHSSYLPSFMPVRAGPWQQKSREGSKPLRWDAIGDFWTFPTKTMWRTRRFATESRMQLECMMIS